VRKLEALGAEVSVFRADVADLRQMQSVVDHVAEKYGDIHGVIHAAAIAGGGLAQLKTSEDVAREFSPKVMGALVLDAVLKDRKPDFMILCSSQTSITGGIGQMGYCAANSFLDAFAHYKAASDARYTVAVDWDRWRNVGLAVDIETQHEMLTGGEAYYGGMTPEEGVEAFRLVLLNKMPPQVVVSTEDFNVLMQELDAVSVSSTLEKMQRSYRSQPAHVRPALRNAYVGPRNEVEHKVARIWQEVLGIERVGIHDDLFELGGNSLVALQLLNRLRENLHVELPLRSLFDIPSVAGMSAMVEQVHGSQGDETRTSPPIPPKKSKAIDKLLEELGADD
jgi:acyl carrier protein